MLIARAPVRLSFAGGGTDLEAYYARYGGAVVSTTIDKYFYVILNVNNTDALQVTSSDYQVFYRHDPTKAFFWPDDLSLPQAVLKRLGIRHGLSMFLASEIPPGTGLGSSSAATAALIKATCAAQGRYLTKTELAEMACQVEIEDLGQPIGKQDQYASAFGGLNLITFSKEGVEVEPIVISEERRRALEESILLFFTGTARNSATILSKQRKSSQEDSPEVMRALHRVKELAYEVKSCLERGELSQLGDILDTNWQNKKRFAAGITNPLIDHAYQTALDHGARGGKITGAGGGGFLMLCCERAKQDAVSQALEAKGLRRTDFRFDTGGAMVLFNAGLQIT